MGSQPSSRKTDSRVGEGSRAQVIAPFLFLYPDQLYLKPASKITTMNTSLTITPIENGFLVKMPLTGSFPEAMQKMVSGMFNDMDKESDPTLQAIYKENDEKPEKPEDQTIMLPKDGITIFCADWYEVIRFLESIHDKIVIGEPSVLSPDMLGMK